MTITGLLAAIAVLLAALAAVGVRVALSLKDIGTSLDRIADRMDGEPAPGGARRADGNAPAAAPAAPESRSAGTPDDTEIAAVIAAAARFARGGAGRASGPSGAGANTDQEERT